MDLSFEAKCDIDSIKSKMSKWKSQIETYFIKNSQLEKVFKNIRKKIGHLRKQQYMEYLSSAVINFAFQDHING